MSIDRGYIESLGGVGLCMERGLPRPVITISYDDPAKLTSEVVSIKLLAPDKPLRADGVRDGRNFRVSVHQTGADTMKLSLTAAEEAVVAMRLGLGPSALPGAMRAGVWWIGEWEMPTTTTRLDEFAHRAAQMGGVQVVFRLGGVPRMGDDLKGALEMWVPNVQITRQEL